METSSNRPRLFHSYAFKLFTAFSVIMLVAISITINVIIANVSNQMIEKESEIRLHIVDVTARHMQAKMVAVRRSLEGIYYSDRETQDIINEFLNAANPARSGFEQLTARERFNRLFISALYNDPDIVDITLIGRDLQRSFVFSKQWSTVTEHEVPFVYPWAARVIEDLSNLTIIPAHEMLHADTREGLVYSAVTSLYSFRNVSTGAIIVSFDPLLIETAYARYTDSNYGQVAVFTREGGVIYDSTGVFYGQEHPDAAAIMDRPSDQFSRDGKLITVSALPESGILVANIATEADLLRVPNEQRTRAFVVTGLSMGIVVLVFFLASRFFAARISVVEHAMERAREGDLSVRIPVRNNRDELDIISVLFNGMCSDLERHIATEYRAQLKLKESELRALQAQINPHFIYNTLEIIRLRAAMNGDHAVSSMIVHLSRLFRSGLRARSIAISLREEIDYCRDYLELNRVRYQDRLLVAYQIDPATENCGVPRLILQPLVENIIVHGIDGAERTVKISVTVTMENRRIRLSIRDTGKGMSPEEVWTLRDALKSPQRDSLHQSIGIRNVHDRMRILFGDDFSLEIESATGTGTTFTLRFPAHDVERVEELARAVPHG